MAESAERSCAMIVSESPCRVLVGTGFQKTRRRALTRHRKVWRLGGFFIACRAGRLGLALGNERVCLVGELGNREQVAETEALSGLPLAPVGVDPGQGDVVLGDPADLVFPNGRLDGADPDFRCGFGLLLAID